MCSYIIYIYISVPMYLYVGIYISGVAFIFRMDVHTYKTVEYPETHTYTHNQMYKLNENNKTKRSIIFMPFIF